MAQVREPRTAGSVLGLGGGSDDEIHRGPPAIALGATVRAVFGAYLGNLLPFTLIGAITLVPDLVDLGPTLALAPTRIDVGLFAVTITWDALPVVQAILNLLLGQLAAGALTYGVFQHLRGRRTGLVDCLVTGLRCLRWVLGAAILQLALLLTGFVLLVLPALLVWPVVCVAVPVAVEERCHAVAALRRSAELTAGVRGSILALYATVWSIPNGLSWFVGGVTVRLYGHVFALPAGAQPAFDAAIGLVSTCLMATCSAVLYYRLRAAREGSSVEELETIFD